MSGYKLYYFPARAKGEIDRWAFAAAKIDFEDIRLNFGEEWRKEKECKQNIRTSWLFSEFGRVLSDNELKVMENEANTACAVACCADDNFIGFVTVIVIRSIE